MPDSFFTVHSGVSRSFTKDTLSREFRMSSEGFSNSKRITKNHGLKTECSLLAGGPPPRKATALPRLMISLSNREFGVQTRVILPMEDLGLNPRHPSSRRKTSILLKNVPLGE